MTTLEAVAKKKAEASAEEPVAAELLRMTKEQGLSLTGPDGLLNNGWDEPVPFLDYDLAIRRVVCWTNAIESLNAATGARSRHAGISPPRKPP